MTPRTLRTGDDKPSDLPGASGPHGAGPHSRKLLRKNGVPRWGPDWVPGTRHVGPTPDPSNQAGAGEANSGILPTMLTCSQTGNRHPGYQGNEPL